MLDCSRTASEEACLFDAMPQTLCDTNCAGTGGLRQDDYELLAAVTSDGIDLAHVLGQQGGNIAQHLIAHVVAETIIELLKEIDIDHDECEPGFLALATLDFQFELLLEIAARLEAGEIVGKSEGQQAFVGVFTGKQRFRDQDKRPQYLCVFWLKSITRAGKKLHGAERAIAHQKRQDQR